MDVGIVDTGRNPRRLSARSWVVVLVLATLASACGGYRPVPPVSEQSAGARYPESEYRIVAAGDTLYSIAWESGRDYRELARWNGIRAPYVVYVGQRIRLFPPPGAGAGEIVVARGDTLYGLAEEAGVSYQELARWNDIAAPYVIRPGQRLRTTPPGGEAAAARAPNERRERSPTRQRESTPASTAAPAGQWEWPTEGTLIARFEAGGMNKGLDIAGERGQAIRAAAPGQVVYTGGGLRGYGQLIILKHDRDFLSAYAHSERIYVTEGDVIKRGQRIAAMGSSGTDRIKLHFEIRYRGSPVDPLKYLPKR